VSVDENRCQGHGNCHRICPEVFQFDDQGFARIEDDQVPEQLSAAVERAVLNCPERAITLQCSDILRSDTK
jgi:ferredoxin